MTKHDAIFEFLVVVYLLLYRCSRLRKPPPAFTTALDNSRACCLLEMNDHTFPAIQIHSVKYRRLRL